MISRTSTAMVVARMAAGNTVELFSSLMQILRPPPKLTISEWAEQNRIMSREESSTPGPWRNDVSPYLTEIMDAISDYSTRDVVMMTASQMGKSVTLQNTIGYYVDCDPCPIMMVQPTIELAESFSGKRIAPMIRDTPVLREKFPDEKSRSSGNTIKEKSFPGGYLVMAGGNSAASLKSRPVRICAVDEVDELPRDIDGQGDPVKLVGVRMTRFANRKRILASTPTIKGMSRIETAYEDSTQEKWSHKCPDKDCGEYAPFVWTRLDFATLKMTCPTCGTAHSRGEWTRAGSKWVADNPDHPVRGFHVTALDNPTLTWQELIDEFAEANRRSKTGDHSALIAFINTRLAETWELPGEVVEAHALMDKREIYAAEVPDGVVVLTMGVDVQNTRLAYEVVGWGAGFESWGIEYGEIWGDPRQGDVWNKIDDLLARKFTYASGKALTISRAAVDTGGHMTTQVYTYCYARESRGVYAVKGDKGDKIPLKRPGKAKGSPVKLFMAGVDGIKASIYSWLRVGNPGAGYCHFPMSKDRDSETLENLSVRGYDANYFAMLTAEKRIATKNARGYTEYVWTLPSGARNEALDCRVYARVALNIAQQHEEKWLAQMSARMPWVGESEDDSSTLKKIKSKQKRDRNAAAPRADIVVF